MSQADVQSQRPAGRFKLTRVGVTGVKKPVQVQRPERSLTLTCTFDIFVDLPAHQKGSHLSRNTEVISEVVEDSIHAPIKSLESLASKITGMLLERHEYARDAEVTIVADYFLPRSRSQGHQSMEPYTIMASSRAVRGNGSRVEIGVKVIGMTACPCAMHTVREMYAEGGVQMPEGLPAITHNQRNVSTVMLEVPDGYPVEADDLISIVESSLSSPSFEILKRRDEGQVVIDAHSKPMFVEDVVREILGKLMERYSDLPDDMSVKVTSISEESIHKHNAYAERSTTLGELRK